MKLRNKKTGEIKDVESLGHESSLKDKYGLQITLSWDTEYENLSECRTYNSLAELNEEWEDYEEPKEHWTIGHDGAIFKLSEWEDQKDHEEIGNYFETKEEAEKAVEKLKAFKRLKDKGFRFEPVDRYEALCGNGFNIPITATMPPEAYTDVEVSKDLDVCFGGEE